MAEMNIKDYINRELSSADREIALRFVHCLEDNHLTFYKDNCDCWKDKIYYWVKLEDKCVCFIAVNDPDEKDNRWTVWSDDMGSEWLEKSHYADEIKETAWKHIDHCGNCGSCGGGRRKVIFGKEFNDVCGCTFRVDNPDLEDLLFLEKMTEIRIKEIQGFRRSGRAEMISGPIKQRNIFIRELENFTNDRTVSGVLLTGSVACGCASENSDIDIIVLCDRHCFETHFTDGILVETSFVTYEYAVEKLNAEPMDVYHYLDAEIAFDRDGRLSEIMALAKQKYESYHTPQKVRDGLYHWLMTVKIKLETADVLKKRYLAHINAWKVLEAVWVVNNRPMPPAGTAYRKRGELQTVPCENWFEKLFSEDCCGTMSEIIDFLLPILKKGDVYGRKEKRTCENSVQNCGDN